MSNTKEEPFLLSPYQMAEVERLTEELQAVRDRVRERNNFFNVALGAFGYPIKETHEKVYHVSGFKPLLMYKVLFGEGLKWKKDKGIYYNTTEYAYRQMSLIGSARGLRSKKRHISELHAEGFYLATFYTKHWLGNIWFRIPLYGYLKRFGLLPLNATYEISTKGFETDDVYHDNTYETPPTDENGEETTFRYIPQRCIPSQYIRLKAVTFVLPMFGLYKVLWRRK